VPLLSFWLRKIFLRSTFIAICRQCAGVKFVNASMSRLSVQQLNQEGCIKPVVSGERKILVQRRN
jgi:hypothetical protein